jgi:hypothetical protein
MSVIPEGFQMGSRAFIVEKNSKIEGFPNYLGLAMFNERRIILAEDLDAETEEEVYWHEMIHIALSCLGKHELNDDEEFVDLLAQHLLQAMRTSYITKTAPKKKKGKKK